MFVQRLEREVEEVKQGQKQVKRQLRQEGPLTAAAQQQLAAQHHRNSQGLEQVQRLTEQIQAAKAAQEEKESGVYRIDWSNYMVQAPAPAIPVGEVEQLWYGWRVGSWG